MKDGEVFRDPSVKNQDQTKLDVFRVLWKGKICSPEFNSRGAADAYLEMLRRGQRQPEYSLEE